MQSQNIWQSEALPQMVQKQEPLYQFHQNQELSNQSLQQMHNMQQMQMQMTQANPAAGQTTSQESQFVEMQERAPLLIEAEDELEDRTSRAVQQILANEEKQSTIDIPNSEPTVFEIPLHSYPLQTWTRASIALYQAKTLQQKQTALQNLSQWFNYNLHPKTFALYCDRQKEAMHALKEASLK